MGATEPTPRRAVVIEDDADIASLLQVALASQGFEVTIAPDGVTGIERVAALDPDLVTLDVGLPGIDGLEVCRRIRPTTDAYVIMVTAYGEEIDRLIGLETGADDYLTKPISVRELKARVNVLFRRPWRLRVVPGSAGPPADHVVLRHGDLVVDVDAHRVWRDGEQVDLTPTEFSLLATLMRAPTRVWTRALLLEEVWGGGWDETHLVEVHMGNLRRKLGDRRGQARFVENVRGVGYRMLAAG
ncbi:response regulator transcription factor [Nocardioides sp. T2.26MG-1]|uniref:response regulator transcription factor n=1 Tax=Nocardioides sp. T2.26MG-1 TaxID=3041166 RepID=UPI00247797CD|nr:response regulator transcription factor [Nocardioides sp. T2.26MG-1]CAI9412855.1 Transcriptional regulatory protein WalR [Nocardioides sp. T2.26MG-1]